MSKPITLSTILANLFPGSQKVISEKLTTEEHIGFSAEVQELNDRIDAQTQANELLVADLATANATIAGLQANLATANTNLQAANANLTAITGERDRYKAHYDKIGDKGNQNPGEDENSRKPSGKAGYNQHALDVWHKANRKQ